MLYHRIVSREPINKGWSGDTKFKVLDESGNVCLLRISPMDLYHQRKAQFARMQALEKRGIPMCLPLEFGTCGEGVYMIHSWIDGWDAEDYIPHLSPQQQYAYGLESGQILQTIHSLPAPGDAQDWETRFNNKIDRKLRMYADCPLKYDNDAPILAHIAASRHLLAGRPQSYQHGDYHIGNMMVDHKGALTIIDFEKEDHGDPWEEFNRIVWCAQAAPFFASGMVDGYFGGQVPMEFWQLLALYICSNTLSSLPWAIPFGSGEIETMRRQQQEIMGWYDNLQTTVPSWYRKP